MFRPKESNPTTTDDSSHDVVENNLLGSVIKSIMKNATDPSTIRSVLRDPKLDSINGNDLLLGISQATGHHARLRSKAFLNTMDVLGEPERYYSSCWEIASSDMYPFLMLMLSMEPAAMEGRPSFDLIPNLIELSVMALKISDSAEKSINFLVSLLAFLDDKLKIALFSEMADNAENIPYYSSHLLNHFPLQKLIFWAERGAQTAYILCIDISRSNILGYASSSLNRNWNLGTNALNMVWLVDYILSNPEAQLFVSPWGGSTRHPLFRITDVKQLMSLRCVTINDAGNAGILNKFSTTEGEDVQKLYEKFQESLKKLEKATWEHSWLEKVKMAKEAKILELLPINAAWDYSGPSLYSQIFDALEQAFDLPEECNIVFLLHTDGLLDALKDPTNRNSERLPANLDNTLNENFQGYLGRIQLCEKLSNLNFSDKNFTKFLLQFAVHADADVVNNFSKTFADVCLKALGHGSATLGIIHSANKNHAKYIQEAQSQVPLRGFKLNPRFISLVHDNRALQFPRLRPSLLCKAFTSLNISDQEQIDIIQHVCSFLIDRINSVASGGDENLFLLEKQFEQGDLGNIYGFITKMNNNLQNKLNIAAEWGQQADPLSLKLLELTSSVSSYLSQIMPALRNDRQSALFQSLIIKAKEDRDQVISLVNKIKTESYQYKRLGYLGIGFKENLPTYYNCTKAISVDCKNAHLILKHLRCYELESLEDEKYLEVYVASNTKSIPKGYGDFLMAQCQLAFCLLTGNIVIAPSMILVFASFLLSRERVGIEAHEIDPILHNLFMELVKHFNVSAILPKWKLDNEGFWVFEQDNFQMNPNFWKAVILTSRFQPNLSNGEIEKYEAFKSRNSHLIDTELQSDGSIKVINKETGIEMSGCGLSFEANRIVSQLELYRGLVRLKALQSICILSFKSELDFETKVFRSFDISEKTYQKMEEGIISAVPVDSKGNGIWLPKCMFVNGEFDPGPVTNIHHICAVYAPYNYSLKRYEAGDCGALVSKVTYLNGYGSFLYRSVFINDNDTSDGSKGIYETIIERVGFSVSFRDILSAFGTSYFGINPVLLERVLQGNNPKVSREDVREYACFAVQNPAPPTISIEEICQFEFKVKTVKGETRGCRLTADQWESIAKVYSDSISNFLSPNVDEIGNDVEVFSLCCCCMESMAFHLDGDRKAQKLDCGHLICTSCSSDMLSVALSAPLQLVSCPYCRSTVSTKTLNSIGETCDIMIRNVIRYSRTVIHGIPLHLKGVDLIHSLEEKELLKIIADGMKQFYFGVCNECYVVCSIEKQCAASMPKKEMFKCTDCVATESVLSADLKCPHCLVPVIRVDGCAFMTCYCRGHFCIHCGCKLLISEHFSHFDGNPFSKTCKGKR